jgi:hypothetical protein
MVLVSSLKCVQIILDTEMGFTVHDMYDVMVWVTSWLNKPFGVSALARLVEWRSVMLHDYWFRGVELLQPEINKV